jgi:hypothetical protein
MVAEPRADAAGAAAQIQPVFGVKDDPELLTALDELVTDASELISVNLDDCDVMILGFERDPGGEMKPLPDGSGEFLTTEQIVMWLRVYDMDNIETTRQFFGVPRSHQGDDGGPRRKRANEQSKYGIWLNILASLGVAGNPQQATRFKFDKLSDLIGLRYHRVKNQYAGFRDAIEVHVPTEIYGFDNDFRTSIKLKAANLTGEPVAVAAAAAN